MNMNNKPTFKDVVELVCKQPIDRLLERRNQAIKDIWKLVTKTSILKKYRKEIHKKHPIPRGLSADADFREYPITYGDREVLHASSRWLDGYPQREKFTKDVQSVVLELNLPRSAVEALTYYFLYNSLPKAYVPVYDFHEIAFSLLVDGIFPDYGIGYTVKELTIIKKYLGDFDCSQEQMNKAIGLLDTYTKDNKRKSAPLNDVNTDIKIINSIKLYKTKTKEEDYLNIETIEKVIHSEDLATNFYPSDREQSPNKISSRYRMQLKRLIKKYPILTR